MITSRIDFAGIKAAYPLADYCSERGIELRRSGQHLQGKCPVHSETQGGSFTVWPEENRWRCFGKCARGGDVVDLHAALSGMPLKDAARHLAGLGVPDGTKAHRMPPTPTRGAVRREAYVLADGDIKRMNAASHLLAQVGVPPAGGTAEGDGLSRGNFEIAAICDSSRRLRGNGDLCHRIAAGRGWDPEVVRRLALDGDLGWENGRLLFGYSHGIKWRWRENGERVIRWLVGGPHGQSWRQSLLCEAHRLVVFAEGETDAISLICAGYESDQKTLVLGLPSATSLPNPEPFKGREILIFPDRDAAGTKSANALAALLYPVAVHVRIVDWSGLETKEVA